MKKTVTSQILGGLGNQMFQYAAGYALAKKNNAHFKIDISEFSWYFFYRLMSLNRFNISASIADPANAKIQEKILKFAAENNPEFDKKILYYQWRNRLKRRLWLRPNPFIKTYIEKNLYFDDNFFALDAKNIWLRGYFMSQLYFQNVESELRKEFTLKDGFTADNQKLADKISGCTPSVAIHLRRGDYLDTNHAPVFHSCPLAYYQKAMKIMEAMLGVKPNYFIFSNDIDYIKQQFGIRDNVHIVIPKDDADYEQMFLMGLCQHIIIANSTFSVWASWLNNEKNDKIIMAPFHYYNHAFRIKNNHYDLFPKNAIILNY